MKDLHCLSRSPISTLKGIFQKNEQKRERDKIINQILCTALGCSNIIFRSGRAGQRKMKEEEKYGDKSQPSSNRISCTKNDEVPLIQSTYMFHIKTFSFNYISWRKIETTWKKGRNEALKKPQRARNGSGGFMELGCKQVCVSGLLQPLNFIINSRARVMSRRWIDAEMLWNCPLYLPSFLGNLRSRIIANCARQLSELLKDFSRKVVTEKFEAIFSSFFLDEQRSQPATPKRRRNKLSWNGKFPSNLKENSRVYAFVSKLTFRPFLITFETLESPLNPR